MEVDFESLKMQKRNIPTDRAQIVAAQNGVICTIIVFSPGGRSLKCHKWLFFTFR